MTPKRLLLASLALVSVSFLSNSAFANPPRYDEHEHDGRGHEHDGRGGWHDGRDDRDHHGHDGHGPHEPPPYYPPSHPHEPPPPYYPPPAYNPPPSYPGNGGYQSVRTVVFGRWVMNETLSLGAMLGIGYGSSTVIDAVDVNIRGGSADLRLLIDGAVVDSTFSSTRVTLYPRQRGFNAASLQLLVNGQVLLNDVTVTYHTNDNYNPNPGYGEVRVPVNVYRRMIGNDRIDLGMYTNLGAYRGYRLVAIEVTATAVYNNAFLNVMINSFSAGGDQTVDRFSRTLTIYPSGVSPIIGQGVDSIVLTSRGDLDLQGVVLRLSR